MKPALVKQSQDNTKSRIQAKFEKLLADLEAKKQFQMVLHDGIRKAYTKLDELLSLQKESQILSRDFIIRLDQLSDELGIGKYNREWFENYLIDELELLIDIFGHQDQSLSKLYEKYAGISADDIAKDSDTLDLVQSIKDAFGFDIDLQELLKKGKDQYFSEHMDEMRKGTEKKDNADEPQKKHKKKFTGKDKGKATEDASKLINDARSVYLRLIKKFHPDLEGDPTERDKKTEIVKQVTKAYQENDFFALLKLQITYLDENESDATKVADDMLTRYNKILQKQLNELNTNIYESHLVNGEIITDFIDKNGKFSPQKFNARKRELEKHILALKQTLADSKKKPKGWFKEQIKIIKDTVHQEMMSSMFADIFN